MTQTGQVFELQGAAADGRPVWAYRYRVGGRGSRRAQRGGFESEQAAAEALARALERLRREQGLVEAPRLRELVDVYLAQHDGEPETIEKLRWLLAKAVRSFGHRRINRLRPAEIAAWRMTIPAGHRFEATQALRQVLARAVSWGLIDVTQPSRVSTTRSAGERRSGCSSPGQSSKHSQPSAGRATGRSFCSLRRRGYVPASGSRSSIATSIATRAWSMCVAHIGMAGSSGRRPRRAFAPCPCRRSRSLRSSECRRTDGRCWCFRHLRAATLIRTTSATATGGPPRSQPGSRRFGVS